MKILRAAIFAVGLFITVSAANAQQTGRVVGDVPFSFVANNQAYPAGEYSLSLVGGDNEAISIHNINTSDSRVSLVQTKEKMRPAAKTVLVFHRVGDQYFLSEIWREGSTTGRVLPESKQESKLAKNEANPRDQVIVAAVVTR